MAELQEHLDKRLGLNTFHLEIPARTRRFLLEQRHQHPHMGLAS